MGRFPCGVPRLGAATHRRDVHVHGEIRGSVRLRPGVVGARARRRARFPGSYRTNRRRLANSGRASRNTWSNSCLARSTTSSAAGYRREFPLPRTYEVRPFRARDHASRTLEAIRTHLPDTYDGGFFRYSTERAGEPPA